MPKILIEAPSKGIAQSPHVGFGGIRGITVDETPGVAELNNIMVKRIWYYSRCSS